MKINRLTLLSLTSILIVSMTFGAWTCNKASVDSWTLDTISSLRAAKPLIESFLPGSGPLVDQGISAMNSFKTAYDSGATTAVGYLSSGIKAFEEIVAQAPQIKDEAKRTRLMAALALADISLNLIANHLPQPTPALVAHLPGAQVDVIQNFRTKEVWGKAYKR